jgi:hypothetical protein
VLAALLVLVALLTLGGASRRMPEARSLPASTRPADSVPAYWLVAKDGGVFAFGGLPFLGSMGGKPLDEPMVGMAPTADGGGYWLVASDGGIFTFGDAGFYGSTGGKPLNDPIVGMAATPDGKGYWLVASDGGIFSFGDAGYYGSVPGSNIHVSNIVGMAPTADGRGYWMVGSDGGIFGYGDAANFGSLPGSNIHVSNIVSMATTPDGQGYWLAASGGGIFTFGDALYQGSLGSDPLKYPEVAAVGTGVSSDLGYWMVNSNGAVSSFGPAGNFGSAPQHLTEPVVGMADGPGTGAVTNTAYSSGSFGYDISNYQCNSTLPSGHTIGIVEATGASMTAANPCIAQEATWAGGGLNLYIFMTYGTDSTNQPGCAGDPACNFGFEAAQYAFNYVQAQGVSPFVTWWLDVECTASCGNWSSNTAENDQLMNGAMIELRGLGINTVGVYTSPLTWNTIAGNYQPAVPVWVAWWTNNPQTNCTNAYSYAQSNGDSLPTGGILVTQYTDNEGGFDGDYAC